MVTKPKLCERAFVAGFPTIERDGRSRAVPATGGRRHSHRQHRSSGAARRCSATLYGARDADEFRQRWRAALAAVAARAGRDARHPVRLRRGAGARRGVRARGRSASAHELLSGFRCERSAQPASWTSATCSSVPQLLHDEMLSDGAAAAARASRSTAPRRARRARCRCRRCRSPSAWSGALLRIATRRCGSSCSAAITRSPGRWWRRWRAHVREPWAIVHPDAHTDLLAGAAGRPHLLRDLGLSRQRAARARRAAGAGRRARLGRPQAALGVDAGRAAVLGGRGRARAARR